MDKRKKKILEEMEDIMELDESDRPVHERYVKEKKVRR